MRTTWWLLLALGALGAARPVGAQTAVPGPSFEAVLSLKAIGSPALSPDGRLVAFTVRTTDWKENRYDSEIWLSRDGATPIQLTRTTKGGSSSPRWSPDGRWIGFLADRGEKQQVPLTVAIEGGELVAKSPLSAEPEVLLAESSNTFVGTSNGTRFEFDLAATGKARGVKIGRDGFVLLAKRK